MSRSTKSLYGSVFLCLLLAFTGCATDSSKSDTGTLWGAVLGGLLGSQTGDNNKAVRILVGAALGGMIGRTIGRYMDENDRKKVAQSLDESQPGGTTSWTNPDTGNEYEFTPGEQYISSEGHSCRDFVQEAIINGKREQVNGTACKEPENGQWNLS